MDALRLTLILFLCSFSSESWQFVASWEATEDDMRTQWTLRTPPRPGAAEYTAARDSHFIPKVVKD